MKNFFIGLLLAIPFFSHCQGNINYEITGRLMGVDAQMVYAVHSEGELNQVIDSASVINHAYLLKGHVSVGQQTFLMTYNFKNSKTYHPDRMTLMFLCAGKYEVTHVNAFGNITVSGSRGYESYQLLKTEAKPYEEREQALQIKIAELTKKRDTVATKDATAQLYAFEQTYRKKIFGGFIKAHPTSEAAFYALKVLGGTGHSIDGQLLKPYFDMLPKHIREGVNGKEFGMRINDAITFDTKGAIGSVSQDFTLPDTVGKAIKLSDYKGKYVLLDIWASWCTPCREDNPHLVSAYKKYHGKGFEILSVSLDTRAREKAWRSAIVADHLGAWTHVADLDHQTNTVVALYGISGIPQNYLIAPDGKIIGRSLRGGELEKKLNEIFTTN